MRGLFSKLIRNGGEQPELRLHRLTICVEQQEAASTVGILGLSRLETGLPHQRRLLVSQVARERNAAQRARRDMSIDLAAGDDAWQHGCWDTEQVQYSRVPSEGCEVHQLRAAGVADIGDMYAAISSAG